MTELQATKPRPASRAKAATGRLFVIEINAGRIHAMNPDGSDKKTIVTNCRMPDGIVVDTEARHIYWTNMGVPNLDDGSIERADLDGGNRRVIVPQGVTHTPKQIHLDKEKQQALLVRPRGHARDAGEPRRFAGRNAGRDRPRRHGPARSEAVVRRNHHRSEACENLLVTKRRGQRRPGPHLPRQHRHSRRARARRIAPTSRWCSTSCRTPIDLELDLANRVLYWTDRGDPPRGNTVNRTPIDKKAVPEILITHLMEGIGIALDVPGNRMFVTDFAGSVYSADLDGKNERNFLYAQGNLTGIAYAEI